MCDPISAITAGIGVVNTVSSYKSAKAQNEQAKADMRAAYRAGSLDLSTLQERLQQAVQANDVEVFDRGRQGLKDRDKIMIAAGEANVSGNSVMRMIAANMFDESRDKGIRQSNLDNTLAQGAMEAMKVRADASSNAAYSAGQRVNPFLQTLPTLANAGINTYTSYRTQKYG